MATPQADIRPCKGCGKPVRFVQDDAGKWQILDIQAPVWFIEPTLDGTLRARRAAANIHVSHFSTCPKASEFSHARQRRAEKDTAEE